MFKKSHKLQLVSLRLVIISPVTAADTLLSVGADNSTLLLDTVWIYFFVDVDIIYLFKIHIHYNN